MCHNFAIDKGVFFTYIRVVQGWGDDPEENNETSKYLDLCPPWHHERA